MARLLVALLVMFAVVPASAQDAETRMDALFAELGAAETEEDAAFIAEEIEAIWIASGDDTADLLIERAGLATAAENHALAQRLINGALKLKPDYADGWARSAAYALEAEEIAVALTRINRALELQPRHYPAMLILGSILESMEQPVGAFEAYERVLALYPLHPTAAARADRLERAARGREL